MQKQRKLTLKSSYKSLLKCMWDMKKLSHAVNKENSQLKGKVNSRKEFRKWKTAQNKCRPVISTQQPLEAEAVCRINELKQKFQLLAEKNNELKEKIEQSDNQLKQTKTSISSCPKIQKKIRRLENSMKKSVKKIRKMQLESHKIVQPNQIVLNTQLDGEEKIKQIEEEGEKLLSQLEHKVNALQSEQQKAKKVGKEIIKLINRKNELKRSNWRERSSHNSTKSSQIR